jgi:hypothetical protein
LILKYYIDVCRCKCRVLEFLTYVINIEKAPMIYLSPVQQEHAKRKVLDLEYETLNNQIATWARHLLKDRFETEFETRVYLLFVL